MPGRPRTLDQCSRGLHPLGFRTERFQVVKIGKVERPRFRANVSPHQPGSNFLNSNPSTTRNKFIQVPTHLAIYPRPSTGAPQYTNTLVVGLKCSRYRLTWRTLLMPWTSGCSNLDQKIKTILFLLQPSSVRPVDSECRDKPGRETARLACRMHWLDTYACGRKTSSRWDWDPAGCADGHVVDGDLKQGDHLSRAGATVMEAPSAAGNEPPFNSSWHRCS